MRRIALTCLVIALLAVLVPLTIADDNGRTAAEGAAKTPASVRPAHDGPIPLGVGTIVYDNNVPFQRDGQVDGMIGNRFSPPGTHTINSVSFRVAGNYGTQTVPPLADKGVGGYIGDVVISIWNPTTGAASLLHRQIISGVPAVGGGGGLGISTITDVTVAATLSVPVATRSGDFLAGMRNSAFPGCSGNTSLNSTCDGVALTQGTATIGQGFNAVRLPFTSATFLPTVTTLATSGTPIANRNAIFRATGNNLPVELIGFKVK